MLGTIAYSEGHKDPGGKGKKGNKVSFPRYLLRYRIVDRSRCPSQRIPPWSAKKEEPTHRQLIFSSRSPSFKLRLHRVSTPHNELKLSGPLISNNAGFDMDRSRTWSPWDRWSSDPDECATGADMVGVVGCVLCRGRWRRHQVSSESMMASVKVPELTRFFKSSHTPGVDSVSILLYPDPCPEEGNVDTNDPSLSFHRRRRSFHPSRPTPVSCRFDLLFPRRPYTRLRGCGEIRRHSTCTRIAHESGFKLSEVQLLSGIGLLSGKSADEREQG